MNILTYNEVDNDRKLMTGVDSALERTYQSNDKFDPIIVNFIISDYQSSLNSPLFISIIISKSLYQLVFPPLKFTSNYF